MNGRDRQIRLIAPGDAAEFLDLIGRNRDRLQDSFPVTVGSVTGMESAVQYIQEKIGQAARGTGYLFVATAGVGVKLEGAFFIREVDRRNAKAELAYFVDAHRLNHGLGTAGLAHIVRYCFYHLNLNKVYLRTLPDNIASRRVAEKNGFAVEGILRSDFRVSDGQLIDVVYYGRLRE